MESNSTVNANSAEHQRRQPLSAGDERRDREMTRDASVCILSRDALLVPCIPHTCIVFSELFFFGFGFLFYCFRVFLCFPPETKEESIYGFFFLFLPLFSVVVVIALPLPRGLVRIFLAPACSTFIPVANDSTFWPLVLCVVTPHRQNDENPHPPLGALYQNYSP